jgi:competence protein ComEA
MRRILTLARRKRSSFSLADCHGPILTAFIFAFFAFAAQAAVDANKAKQAELETVKGIGPGLSSKILDARKAGAFKDWNDLVERVGGVGPGNAARFSQAGQTVNSAAFSTTAAVTPDKAAAARKPARPADAAPAPAHY